MAAHTPWVTPQQVRELAYGFAIGNDELESLEPLIRHAERKILGRRNLQVKNRINAGTLDVETVQGVVADMVLRVIRNPAGVQSDGAGSVSTSYFRGAASGSVELLEEDVEALAPTPLKFGTVGVGIPAWRVP